MRKALAALLIVVVILVVAGVSTILLRRAPRSPGSASQDRAVAGTGPSRLLLNEVQFLPAAGQSPWIELVNAGGEVARLDGVILENQSRATFTLPNQLMLSAGAVVLIRFDGQSGAEASVVHAPTGLLRPAGFVQLARASERLDRVAWGDGQADAVSLGRGSFDDGTVAGGSIARVPRTIGSDSIEWVWCDPRHVTPGAINPQPRVEVLMPLDGATVFTTPVTLTWYPIVGAMRYRVQVASDKSFGAIALDQVVDNPPLRATTLTAGNYFWHVQAVSTGGAVAEYSPPNALAVRAGRLPAPKPRKQSWRESFSAVLHAQQPPQDEVEMPTVLDVPLILQHKDTAMLLIETKTETGSHAWDVDHVEPGPDRADLMNSAPASIAMLTAYYGGRLSQDRINYEVFHADQPGPQGDLGWAPRGYNRDRVSRAMAFAFGVPPRIDPPMDEVLTKALWAVRMDSRTPAVACRLHCVAIIGFGLASLTVVVNDPAQGTYLAPMSFLHGATVFVMERPNVAIDEDNPTAASGLPMLVRPRSDEPEVARDSDGDGVVDFDERERFHTDPSSNDSDQDDLPDKEDIKASVHDPRHGFAYGGNGRDFDGDGTMMELDDDSDDGGCLDGWEDTNKNGKFERERKELDFFLKADDPCIKGRLEIRQDSRWDQAGPPQDTQTLVALQQYELSLRPIDRDKWEGRARARLESRTTRLTITPASRCEERTDQRQTPYILLLTGESRMSQDGRIELDVRLARQITAPPLRLAWQNSCSTPRSGRYEGPGGPAAWPFPHFTLVNGVYDETTERAIAPPVGSTGSGRWTTKIHLEQKRAQRR